MGLVLLFDAICGSYDAVKPDKTDKKGRGRWVLCSNCPWHWSWPGKKWRAVPDSTWLMDIDGMRRWELMVLKSSHRDADYHWDIDYIYNYIYIYTHIYIYYIQYWTVYILYTDWSLPGTCSHGSSWIHWIQSLCVCTYMYRHMYNTILYRVMICTHTHTMSWNSRLWFWQFIWAHRPGLWTANPSHGESCAVSLLRV